MNYRSLFFSLTIFCLVQTAFGQLGRPGIVPSLRPVVKDEWTDDFTVGDVKGSVKTNAVFLPKPVYPLEAREAGIEGTVRVKIRIDNEGNVSAAVAEAGESLLLRSAEEAAKRSKFRMARDAAGQPAESDGSLSYTFEIRPAGWTRIGSGLKSIQRFSISGLPIPMIRKAMEPQWAGELDMLERLETIKRSVGPPAPPPTIVRGPVLSGTIMARGSASQTATGTFQLPQPPSTEQMVISQELINALRDRIKPDPLKTWQFDLGTSLPDAFELYRNPRQSAGAADTLVIFIQSKPDGVSDEVIAALKSIEASFRMGNRNRVEAEEKIRLAMKTILREK